MSKKLFLLFCSTSIATIAFSQKMYKGIVVDSASMVNLPGAHVSVKHSKKITSTDGNGSFWIDAHPTDTLLITSVGYTPVEVPLLWEEETLFVMMPESKILLAEIVIKSKRLYPNKIEDRTKVAPRTISLESGLLSPFDYFWKLEREKRKLSRIVEENNRTQTFLQVITDPDVKEILMKEYKINEEKYCALLTLFNQEKRSVHYYTDPDAIMEALHAFFEERK